MNLLNSVIRYFDLVSDLRPTTPQAKAEGKKLPPWWPQYIFLVLGIIVQPYFSSYQQTGIWSVEGILGRTLFAIIAGFIILPSVYRNSFDPEKHMVIQLAALFVAGMGWESLLGTALTAVGAS